MKRKRFLPLLAFSAFNQSALPQGTLNPGGPPGPSYGEIVDVTATGTAAVAGSGAAGTLTAPNAWANLSH